MSAQTSRKRSEIAKNKILPSLKTIWKIEKLHLELYFKTDSLKRLYAWQNLVAHRGILLKNTPGIGNRLNLIETG
jgi:hypothetical protein